MLHFVTRYYGEKPCAEGAKGSEEREKQHNSFLNRYQAAVEVGMEALAPDLPPICNTLPGTREFRQWFMLRDKGTNLVLSAQATGKSLIPKDPEKLASYQLTCKTCLKALRRVVISEISGHKAIGRLLSSYRLSCFDSLGCLLAMTCFACAAEVCFDFLQHLDHLRNSSPSSADPWLPPDQAQVWYG